MSQARSLRWSFELPGHFLRGHFLRLTLTVLAIACGVALATATDLVGREASRAFADIIDTMAGRASLHVTAGEGAIFAEDVASRVAQLAGVEKAIPVVSGTVFSGDESGELLTVHGMDLTDETATSVYELRSSGEEPLNDPKLLLSDAIVLTRSYAARHNLALRDRIEFDTPQGRRSFTIHGMLEFSGLARVYGGNLILMDLANAQEVFAREGFVNRVDVVTKRDTDREAVAGTITATLPPGLHVEEPEQRKADLQRVMTSFHLLILALGMLAVGGASLIVMSSLTTLFEGRVWQLGVLRAVGLRTRTVWYELLKEAVLIGGAGVVVGLPLGLVIARLMLPEIGAAAALNSNLAGPPMQLRVSVWALALGALLGFGSSLTAAALPAWRASRAGIAATFRGRGVEQREVYPRYMLGLRFALPLLAVVVCAIQFRSAWVGWGFAATALIAVAIAICARPIVQQLQAPLSTLLGRMGSSAAQLAAEGIARNPRRSGLTVAMLGIGMGTVLWLWAVAQSFEASVNDAVSGAMKADLVVSSVHIGSGFLEAPVEDGLVGELERIPGVRLVVGERTVELQYGGGPISIDAYDPAYFTTQEFGQWPLAGRGVAGMWDAVVRGSGAAISSNFRRSLGVDVGDTLHFDTPNGPLDLGVVGVVTHFASARGTVEMSRDLYERYWGDSKVTRIFVRVEPGANLESVRAEIARRLGRAHNLRILSAAELVNYFTGQVRRAFAVVYIIAGMVLAIIVTGMADTLAAGVIDRVRMLGTLRAIGVRRRHLRKMVLVEATILGTLGLALASAAGAALGVLWVEGTFPSLLGWVLEYYVPYGHTAVACLLTLVACWLAAAVPAGAAARVEPAEALRYE